MPNCVRIIGGAGTGKTTFLMGKMKQAIEAGGYTPYDIGFVSFTRAAALEAAQRASKLFDIPVESLQSAGWFRTLHSICYNMLGVSSGSLIADCKKDREWLAEHLDCEISKIESDDGPFTGASEGERVLSLWQACRNRLVPFKDVHEVAAHCDERVPDIQRCKLLIEKYEQAKRLDHREDFTDIIGRFVGYMWGFNGHTKTEPSGDVPAVPVWFLDEQQDTSPLLDLVCRRLVERARWVYICLDPFQSIYGWAGADYRCAMSWDVQQEKTLQQTFRCPAPVLQLGERLLSQSSDYWDRNIRPADHDGSVAFDRYESPWPLDIDPTDNWLLLARTNFLAGRMAKRLDAQNIPWLAAGNNGNSKWNAPSRIQAVQAMIMFEHNFPIRAEMWKHVLKNISQKGMFVRGTKAKWKKRFDNDTENDLQSLDRWGATDEFISSVKNGRWKQLIKNADEIYDAWNRWGGSAVIDPQVRVGTIHSVKGAEADNVVLFQTTSHQVQRGMDFQDQANEEYRLQYVAATRARRNLLVVSEGARYEMDI